MRLGQQRHNPIFALLQVDDKSKIGHDVYTLWTGATELWNQGAGFLAFLIVVWSGVLPYLKVLFLSYHLWVSGYLGREPPPHRWVVLGVGRLAFFDAFCVLAAASFLRLSIDGDESTFSLTGGADDDDASSSVSVFVQATALAGSYCYLASIAATQALGFAVDEYAKRSSGSALHAREEDRRHLRPPPPSAAARYFPGSDGPSAWARPIAVRELRRHLFSLCLFLSRQSYQNFLSVTA